MQKILIIIHAPPYGSERCLSGLRLATALAGVDGDAPEVKLFLMSDATVLALPNQVDGTGNGLQGMVEQLVALGYPRGINDKLNEIEALDPAYGEFVAAMRGLARQFQFDAMKKRIREARR